MEAVKLTGIAIAGLLAVGFAAQQGQGGGQQRGQGGQQRGGPPGVFISATPSTKSRQLNAPRPQRQRL